MGFRLNIFKKTNKDSIFNTITKINNKYQIKSAKEYFTLLYNWSDEEYAEFVKTIDYTIIQKFNQILLLKFSYRLLEENLDDHILIGDLGLLECDLRYELSTDFDFEFDNDFIDKYNNEGNL